MVSKMLPFTLLVLISIEFISCSSVPKEKFLPIVAFDDPMQGDLSGIGDPISNAEIDASLKIKYPAATSNVYNYSLYEGDIVLPDKDTLVSLIHDTDDKKQLSAIRNSYNKWPRGRVPYVISSSYSASERGLIARAIGEYRKSTCIQFVSRSNEKDYVYIYRGGGCSSMVGRQGGVQYLSLGYYCMYVSTIIHEMMHAVGFWHEQSRTDRDSYINVYWQNILPGMAYNFRKKSPSVTQSLGLGYDYSSVMHYGPYAFSVGGNRVTLQAKNSGITLGNKYGFSNVDIQGINKLYGCGTTVTPTKNTTTSECKDHNSYCSDWTKKGECTSNYKYMVINCKKSCNLCKDTACVDIGPFCADWAKKGECNANAEYMKSFCKKSCSLCGKKGGTTPKKKVTTSGCKDLGAYCADWSRKGECARNPAYMKSYCRRSCGLC